MSRRLLLAVAVVALAAAAVPAVALAAPCDPIQTTPHFRGEVPSPTQVLGFPIGAQEVTAAQINQYIAVVDAESARVTSGTFGPTVATADAPREETKKISTTAKVDSIAISSIIGTASSRIARPRLPCV